MVGAKVVEKATSFGPERHGKSNLSPVMISLFSACRFREFTIDLFQTAVILSALDSISWTQINL